jgi:hypothetical protein
MLTFSANATVKNSKEQVGPNDEIYANLPEDSRKPAAPIDPSSEYSSVVDSILTGSLQELLHQLRFGLNVVHRCKSISVIISFRESTPHSDM